MKKKQRLIVGISGASGAMYGIRLLEVLQDTDIETHLVISKAASITIPEETKYTVKQVQALADVNYASGDIAAACSSGSFKTMGMVVAPCSVKTMSEIAGGITTGLLTRAADVVMKEQRKLVLMVRESPLHLGHLRRMAALAEMGVIIAPPMPAFYPQPKTIEDIINHSVGRVLDLFDIDAGLVKRWAGLKPSR
ncbi:MAG: UbiX family flavin prenyltransferase [Proteobacteria bacterium]|nr:UbiX family flavin prenyltransferase [Pseudomonadota bacterium]